MLPACALDLVGIESSSRMLASTLLVDIIYVEQLEHVEVAYLVSLSLRSAISAV